MSQLPTGETIRIGVVGTGALGRHHTRIAGRLPGAERVGIFDLDRGTAERVAAEHGARVFDSLDALAGEIDAAILAVPTVDHARVGCELLSRGVHLLVEKPMAASLAEADRLLEAAAGADRVLAVGHVEFYNPAVQALLALRARPRFAEVQRLSRFTPRSLDVDVILDLMIHDLQILHALDPSPLAEIRATGVDVLSPKIDIANVRLAFESGLVANVTASRVSTEAVRKLRVFFDRRYVSVDYREQEIKSYRLAEQGGGRAIVEDEMEFERDEPLVREQRAFLAAIRGEDVPWVDGARGRQALATALALVEQIGGTL
jgi:predicted dehydrogenase